MMGMWVQGLSGQMLWANDQGYTTGATDSNGNTYGGTPGGGSSGGGSMPSDQSQSGTIGSGQPSDTSNPNNLQLPNLGDPGAQSGQGAWTSSSGGSGTFGGSGGSGGNYGSPSQGMPYGNYTDSGATGAMDTSGSTGTNMAGSYGGGGGGGGSLGMAGSSGSTGGYGGGYAPGYGLQPNGPDPSNSVGNLADQTNAQNAANRYGSSSNSLGSTVRGPSNISQTGGGFDPSSPSNPYNQAKPWNGGPQSMMGQTGFQGGGAGNPMSSAAQTGFKPGQADPQSMFNMSGYNPGGPSLSGAMEQSGFQGGGAGNLNSSMLNQYGQMMQNPMGALQTAQGSMNPYQGGPQGYLTMSGFNGQQSPLGQSLGTAGFQRGGIGGPQTQAYNQYQGMLADPTSMSANPAYKAIMDASLQATQRSSLAQGGNGGGTMAAELAKTGAAVAGQYLPQMANMYQQGAQQEIGNWQAQNQANQNAGALGTSMYGGQNQANLGYGQLGSNLYGTAGNQAVQAGDIGLRGYNSGVNALGAGAAQQSQNYGLENQANLGYGNLGANIYGTQNQANIGAGNIGSNLFGQTNNANLGLGNMGVNAYGVQNQANLGYGNLANNMWTNAANNQYNLGSAYGNMQMNGANTQSAALAQAQMSPANNYFQNQLTMQGMG